jgi:4-alpha-glucanotransferase
VKAPGLKLFRALEAALGPLPLVAEDLGLITPEVDALRQELGLPGMKVLQFGFNSKGAHIHLPHRFTPDTVAYTGTHDNDTTQGWWKTAGKAERGAVEAYVGSGRRASGLAADPRSGVERSATGDAASAGPLRTRLRGADEYTGCQCRQLELARAGGKLEAGTGGAAGRACRGDGQGPRSVGWN